MHRYAFGKNWADFVKNNLSDGVIEASKRHIAGFLRRERLDGLRVLDIGCGSGIHSLAMLKLGAREVVAFDYDHDAVETTRRVHQWAGAPQNWRIEQGSVLDPGYLRSLGQFDLVYSWGVLHHTGAMWEAVRNSFPSVAPGGELYIALYSSDTYLDPPPDEWLRVKQAYNQASPLRRKAMEIHHQITQIILPQIRSGKTIVQAIRDYGGRGMSIWNDTRDWLGGWPMEFAGLHETVDFVQKNSDGLAMVNVANGEGCTEYLFANPSDNQHWRGIDAARVLQPLVGPYILSGGYGFMVKLPELADAADDSANPRRSRLMLYENGKPLGLAHALHDAIRNHGHGRFAHWQDWLVFSASNNTDPNGNGFTYTFCADY